MAEALAREAADLIVAGRYVVPVDANRTILTDGAVAVRGGVIVAVGPRAAVTARFEGARTLDAGDAVVLPGLINAHTHVPMTVFRGLADDLPLDVWLRQHIWPAEAKHLSADTVEWGTRLGAVEMLLGGTTTFCDMYFYEHEIAHAVKAVGARAVLGQGVLDFPTPQGLDVEANLLYIEGFIETWQDDPLVVPSIAAHAPYSVSPGLLQRVHEIACRYDVTMQIHVAETRGEVGDITERYGVSPVRHLHRLGVLDRRTVAAHCVWIDEAEIAILADCGAGVSHNPRSNLKLASGVAPVPAMLKAGVAVGLGTDGPASNNRLDVLAELQTAALIHKGVSLDPIAVTAWESLELATIGGARALKLDERVGSLEPGKRADLIVLGLGAAHLTPVYDPISHVAYAAAASDVTTVVVDGRVVVEDRRVVTVDEAEVRGRVAEIARRIAGG